MKQIYYVIQTLIHGKGSIPFKVISLALGLGMSILLFARVAYEQSTIPASATTTASIRYGPYSSWKVKTPNRKP